MDDQARKLALAALKEQGLTFAECIEAFKAADTGDDALYVEEAGDHYARDGEVEIDSPTVVSAGDDPGAWVMAWIWVPDRDIWEGPTDSDGEPCRVVNHYHCDACDEAWRDQWSCACNDTCPSCGLEIQPHHSDQLDLRGNVVPEAEEAPA